MAAPGADVSRLSLTIGMTRRENPPTPSPTTGVPLRSEHALILERLIRNELALQRLLAGTRRSASARMSALRRALPTPPPPAPLPQVQPSWPRTAVFGQRAEAIAYLRPSSRTKRARDL